MLPICTLMTTATIWTEVSSDACAKDPDSLELMLIPDDFLTRAIIAGVGFALIAGPLGCFVVWQRLAYLGDAMAHSALLGVALGLLLDFNLMIGVFCICSLIALVLVRVGNTSILSSDSALGILSHSTLAVGLVLVSLMYWVRIDVLDFLLGNIIAVTWNEIYVIFCGAAATLGILLWKWNALISLTVNEQIAASEGLRPLQTRSLLMILLAGTIAVAMKVVGIILTCALLIIPAATARQIAGTPEQMAALAAVFGAISVVGGLLLSLEIDTPPGPSIVVAAVSLFVIVAGLLHLTRRKQPSN